VLRRLAALATVAFLDFLHEAPSSPSNLISLINRRNHRNHPSRSRKRSSLPRREATLAFRISRSASRSSTEDIEESADDTRQRGDASRRDERFAGSDDGTIAGGANVRIRAAGPCAQLLADGLPLHGAQGDSFSLLQVPPLDLEQVEVIKGAASALYGSSALGGVINLVSRRPREVEREVLFNRTSRGGTDVTAWLTHPMPAGWGLTLLGGYHGQTLKEIEEDGWADLAAFDRGLIRPRLFFDNQRGRTLFVTGSVMAEERRGGTLPGAVAPDGQPFEQHLTTGHADIGAAARWLTGAGHIVAARGSTMRQSRDRLFGQVREQTVQSTRFGELSIQGIRGRHTWVAGAAFQQDSLDVQELPWFDYLYSMPSVFAQDEIRLSPRTSLSASGRIDFTPNMVFSPRHESQCS
jgi:iron complex outermembrane receptor protein